MVIHREDLEFLDEAVEDKEGNRKEIDISQGINDEQFLQIAKIMGEQLSQNWDELINNIKIERPELFEVTQ